MVEHKIFTVASFLFFLITFVALVSTVGAPSALGATLLKRSHQPIILPPHQIPTLPSKCDSWLNQNFVQSRECL